MIMETFLLYVSLRLWLPEGFFTETENHIANGIAAAPTRTHANTKLQNKIH